MAHGAGKTSMEVFRELTALRKQPSFRFGSFHPGTDNNVYFHVRQAPGQPGFLTAINFGPTASTVDLTSAGAQGGGGGGWAEGGVRVPRWAEVAGSTGSFRGTPGRGEDFALGARVSLDALYLRPAEGLVLRWEALQ